MDSAIVPDIVEPGGVSEAILFRFDVADIPEGKVWIIVDQGDLYIPSGFLKTIPLWKQWPYEAIDDGRALIRIDEKVFPVQLVKIDDPALRLKLFKQLSEKYDLPAPSANPDPDDTWIFRADSRPNS